MTDTTEMGYYILNYVSDTFTLQEDITTYGKVSRVGEISVQSEYLSSTKEKKNWYW